MNDLGDHYQQKKEIGQRFKQFRETLGKSQKELEKEANNPLIQVVRINMLDLGVFIPDIIFIQYFTETYGLNLTWLVTGAGKPFLKKHRKQKTEDCGQIKSDRRETALLCLSPTLGPSVSLLSQLPEAP